MPRSICYSILWPISSKIKKDDEITLDYVHHVKPELKKYKIFPWFEEDFSTESSRRTYCLTDQFFHSHLNDPGLTVLGHNHIAEKDKYKVFTDMPFIAIGLQNCSLFEVVCDPKQSDICWFHFAERELIKDLPQHVMINQLIGDRVLTLKPLLAALASDPGVIQVTGAGSELDVTNHPLTSSWYPVTFNLVHELPQFLAHYQRLEKMDSISYWICRPWTVAQPSEIVITNSADQIVAVSEGLPMLVSRYISKPILFHRSDLNGKVKFDLRFIVCLRSSHPLQLYIFKNFVPRFSQSEFDLKDLNNHKRHLTTQTGRKDSMEKALTDATFVNELQTQYPSIIWPTVEKSMHSVILKAFKAATMYSYPRGLKALANCRAMFAVDIMLEEQSNSIVPLISGIHLNPDCSSIFDTHPEFYKHIFTCLFTSESQFSHSQSFSKFFRI
ncbi:Tubulin--tyrosine ligase-like protein 12 [Cichlidogyrus casuarinus]|uniref:Tubulin--tyrosine ligase-like protein 12 n=1 Tax=Cichlidogyrus casuarinus TaxID=1844966 RepID=A0ABD2QKW0_9PLAT